MKKVLFSAAILLLAALAAVPVFAGQQSASQTITINVVPRLTLDTLTLSDIVIGQAYSSTLSASGGTQPYTFSVAADSPNPLPAGLSLNATTGVISGTVAALPASCTGSPCSVQVKFSVADSTK